MWTALILSGPDAGDRIEGVEHGSGSVRPRFTIEVMYPDYDLGSVWFESSQRLVSGDLLSASTELATFEIRVTECGAAYCKGLVFPPDAVWLLEEGDRIPVNGERMPVARLGDIEKSVLLELGTFRKGIGALIGETAVPSSEDSDIELRATTGRWRGEIGVRSGYERFARSSPAITILDPENPDEVRQALDGLWALIDSAREVPGINQTDLDEAEELAREAGEILDDPQGDIQQAIDKIVVAEVLVEIAVELAGSDVDEIRAADYLEDSEHHLGGSLFLRLERDWKVGKTGRFYLEEYLETGDRSFSNSFLTRWEQDLLPEVDFYAENEAEIRFYRDDFADHVFTDRADIGLRWKLTDRLRARLGLDAGLRKEFDTKSDDGYRNLAPRVELSRSIGRWSRVGAKYAHRSQWYNEEEDEEFNSYRDRVAVFYDCFGPRLLITAELNRTLRNLNRPDDEDDYASNTGELYVAYSPNDHFAVGLEAAVQDRHYTTTGSFDDIEQRFEGDDNTDFTRWEIGPFVEIRWTDELRTRLGYHHKRVRNDDRVSGDEIDKSLGDYNTHGVVFEVYWERWSRWDLMLREDYEFRNFPNGETGELEAWFADLRNTADCHCNTISFLLVYHLRKDVEMSLSCLNSFEKYTTFTNLNNDQTVVELSLSYQF